MNGASCLSFGHLNTYFYSKRQVLSTVCGYLYVFIGIGWLAAFRRGIRLVCLLMMRQLRYRKDPHVVWHQGYWIATIVAELVLALLASAVVMWFSRKRGYRADTGAADLTGREKMIAALRRLQAAHELTQLPDQLAAFGIAGGGAKGWKRLFLSHPPLEERIVALRTRQPQ